MCVFEFIHNGIVGAKLVSLFDIGRFYAGESPQAKAGASSSSPLFHAPDILIAEANTWTDPLKTAGKPTGHICFEELASLIMEWMPDETRTVHAGAYEDLLGEGRPQRYWQLVREGKRIHPSDGPTSRWELTTAMQRHMLERGMASARSVSAAEAGETMVLFPRIKQPG